MLVMTTVPPRRRAPRATANASAPTVLLTSREVAARLGISVGTLANWRCVGTGPRAVAGRSTGGVRYHAADVDAWILTEWGNPAAT